MNICVLAPENSPSWGGVGAYTFNLLKNLPKKDEVHVITVNREIEDSFDKILENRIHIHNIFDVEIKDSFFHNLGFQIAVFKNLKKLNNEYKFDIVHSHSGHLPHLFSQFASIAPLIVTVHATVYGLKTSMSHYNFQEDKTESWMKLFAPGIQYLEKLGFKMANRLLPISKFTLNQMNSYYMFNDNEKMKILYNAVDTSLFSSNRASTEDPITIIFVGRLYAIKGIDIFIEAIKILSRKKLLFKIKIIGRGETERIQKKLSEFLPIDAFKIEGRVSYFKMPDVYSKSDILVVSSIYENFPTTILEAMSAETLVIASNVGGIPEIIKNGYNGFLFETGNAQQLARILEKSILRQIDIDTILLNAKKTVLEKYDWKNRGKEIYDEYRMVVE